MAPNQEPCRPEMTRQKYRGAAKCENRDTVQQRLVAGSTVYCNFTVLHDPTEFCATRVRDLFSLTDRLKKLGDRRGGWQLCATQNADTQK